MLRTVLTFLVVAASGGGLTVDDYFRDPVIDKVTVSPDGARVAYLAPHAGRLNLFVADVDGTSPRPLTSFTDRAIHKYYWSDPENLIVIKDGGGNERFHAYAVAVDGRRPPVDLTPADASWGLTIAPRPGEKVVYLSFIRDDGSTFVDRIALPGGERTTVAETPSLFVYWQVDDAGTVRTGVSSREEVRTLLYRDNAEEPLREIAVHPAEIDIETVGISGDGTTIYARSNVGADRVALVALDPNDPEHPAILYTPPTVDVWEIRLGADRRITDVIYEEDRRKHHLPDPATKRRYAFVQARFPDETIDLLSSDLAERRHIFSVASDRRPTAYYLYDEPTGRLTRRGVSRPWFDRRNMAAMTPVSYIARDAKTVIHGYLTLPSTPPPPGGYPAILRIHGGPTWRVMWGFDPADQFLAARGYAVFRMNYRGSSGYGAAFERIGRKRWGTLMQDDIADGARWLAKRSDIDETRIGVMGESFGGYSTQMQLARYAELYRCGVSVAGVSDLVANLEQIPYYLTGMATIRNDMVGDPVKERERLRDESPITHVADFEDPLLLIHGTNDMRVAIGQSRIMAEELGKAGKPVRFIEFADEGHDILNAENAAATYTASVDFFADCLAPTTPPAVEIK